jgi:hypothetical protein
MDIQGQLDKVRQASSFNRDPETDQSIIDGRATIAF